MVKLRCDISKYIGNASEKYVQAQEQYQHDDPIFTCGYTVLSSCTRFSGLKLFMPSPNCVEQFGQILFDMVLCADNQVIVLLQSVLR